MVVSRPAVTDRFCGSDLRSANTWFILCVGAVLFVLFLQATMVMTVAIMHNSTDRIGFFIKECFVVLSKDSHITKKVWQYVVIYYSGMILYAITP
jgi:hypothetical protein